VQERFSLVEDSNGENNGWHATGGLGKYNQFREGYIFQANEAIWPLLGDDNATTQFAKRHEDWRLAIFEVASTILRNIAVGLNLREDSHFQIGGPMDVVNRSQFHVKGYSHPPSTQRNGAEEQFVALLAHRDPSVISIVVHNKHSKGLEVWCEKSKSYTDVGHYGPMHCTVLGQLFSTYILLARPSVLFTHAFRMPIAGGSILEMLTHGTLKGPRHRFPPLHPPKDFPNSCCSLHATPDFLFRSSVASPLP
jgi:isopenicillin N synthase-like dioxygenase